MVFRVIAFRSAIASRFHNALRSHNERDSVYSVLCPRAEPKLLLQRHEERHPRAGCLGYCCEGFSAFAESIYGSIATLPVLPLRFPRFSCSVFLPLLRFNCLGIQYQQTKARTDCRVAAGVTTDRLFQRFLPRIRCNTRTGISIFQPGTVQGWVAALRISGTTPGDPPRRCTAPSTPSWASDCRPSSWRSAIYGCWASRGIIGTASPARSTKSPWAPRWP